MKTFITVIAIFFGLLFFESCSTDDLETPAPQESSTFKDPNEGEIEQALVPTDSLSSAQEGQIDPPTLPPVKP